VRKNLSLLRSSFVLKFETTAFSRGYSLTPLPRLK